MLRRISPLLALPLFLACASTGTRPADMTGPEHEAAGGAETAEAAHHEAQYQPAGESSPCPAYTRGACSPFWSSVSNPTERHLREANEHRELAAKHRAASAALRSAEARSCAGIPAADRDMSPFYHREDIDRVETIEKEVLGPGGLLGARVVFRAKPGLTAEWLQRVVDCHVARFAAMGDAGPHSDYCPLTLKGVTAKVKSMGNGFAVDITADREETASLVVGRAQALVTRS